MMNLIGFPEPDPPVRAVPWTGDFITALFCLWSSLSGYIYSQRTGKGQVIDLAQYEAVHQVLAGTMVAYYELGLDRQRSGNKAGLLQPYDCYQAKDGWVNVAATGPRFEHPVNDEGHYLAVEANDCNTQIHDIQARQNRMVFHEQETFLHTPNHRAFSAS